MSLIHRLWPHSAPAEGGDAGHRCEPAMDVLLEAALDFRRLSAPEPMVRALAAADALPPGGTVAVLTPLMPLPLLELLAARGLLTRSRELADGGVMTLIHHPGGPHDQRVQGHPEQDRQVQDTQIKGARVKDIGIGTTGT